MDRTGFIGVGNMGGAMALRLLDAGFPLTVCDPSPAAVAAMVQRGAQVAASPKEVADRAEIVFASLPSQEISQDVALGKTGIATGSAIKVYVEMSTLGTKMVQSIADGLLPSGIGFIESPVSGGPLGAKAGTLTAIPCGARTAYERALPALKAIAPNLFYLGDKPGQAQIAKLINNHLGKAGTIAAFEGVVMGLKAGLDPKSLIDFINVSTGRNFTTTDKFPKAIFSGTFKLNGSMYEGLKNARLYLEEAKRLGVPTWMGPGIVEMFQEAADNGYKNRDAMEMIEYVEQLADVDPAHRLSRGMGAKKD